MAIDILYNDDVDMTDAASSTQTDSSTDTSDSSSHDSAPVVDPISVSDGSTRDPDGWTKDTTASGGTAGETYTDTAPTEKDPLTPVQYKTIQQSVRKVITDYSQTYLQQLLNNGGKFYVVYTDGTENEVAYTEIYDPHGVQVDTYVEEGYRIANATNQHFWHDTNGAHVTDMDADDYKAGIASNFSDLSDAKPYNNVVLNSQGMLLRRGAYNLSMFSKSAVSFYDGTGNDLANMRASFGADGATFRNGGKTKATITTQGLSVYDNAGTISGNNETLGNRLAFLGVDAAGNAFSQIGRSDAGFVQIGSGSGGSSYIDFYKGSTQMAHIGYETGTNADAGQSLAPYYTFGIRDSSGSIGNYSFAEGNRTTASGYVSHAEGSGTVASGSYSHVEGLWARATGSYSHAEGSSAKATGNCSHAEGAGTTASGDNSHAEGDNTTASGVDSHAEGSSARATGDQSHAGGFYTVADQKAMTAIGFANRIGITNAIFAVGNGTITSANSRRNAFTVIGAQGSTASAYVGGNTTSNGSTVTSDERVKTLIEDVSTDKAIQFIQSVTPRMYYKEDANPEGELGFYAQEVEKTIFGDQLVTKDNSGMYDLPDFRVMSYEGFIAPMVAVLQNVLDRVDNLEKVKTN